MRLQIFKCDGCGAEAQEVKAFQSAYSTPPAWAVFMKPGNAIEWQAVICPECAKKAFTSIGVTDIMARCRNTGETLTGSVVPALP